MGTAGMNEQQIAALLIRIQEGMRGLSKPSLRTTRAHTYSMIYFLVGSERDVDDILSEVYIALFRSLDSYNVERPFLPWFNGLIIRQARGWKRRLWRSFRILERMKSVQPTDYSFIDSGLDEVSYREEILPHVNGLSHQLREVIVLRYFQDYSLETIAEILNIPVGTVKSRNHAALKKLRVRLEGKSGEKEMSSYVH